MQDGPSPLSDEAAVRGTAEPPFAAVDSPAWAAIRCPHCLGSLKSQETGLQCLQCGSLITLSQGVLRCAEDDLFYEGAFRNTVRHEPGHSRVKDWVFFSLLQSGVFGKLREALPSNAVLVDVGCAAGVQWLGRFHTIGVDLSFSAVRQTRRFYEVSAQANASCLPLAAESVDVVYSSYLFEHVPADSKDACLREFARVMRPNARCVMLFDVLSSGLFGRFAQRDARAFQRGFIEKDGHIGLEPLTRALERMERHGLQIEHVGKFGTTPLQYMASYHWLDKAYGSSIRWVRLLGRAADAVSNSRLRLPVELAITAFDKVINRFSALDTATRALVVARKVVH